MSTPRILGFLALVISWLSIALGYSVRAQWWGVLAALVPVVVFGVAVVRDPRPAFQESACLVAVYCIAGAGMLVGAAPFPMILGATAALAAWDLFSPNRPTGPAAGATARSYERKRELSLALALAAGLLLAAIGKLLALQVPFVLVVLLVLLDVFSLDRLSRYLRS